MKLARPSVATLAVAAVALLGACTSNPSARAVAEDVVEALNEEGEVTDSQQTCLLNKLDDYTDDELELIGSATNQAIDFTQPDPAAAGTPEFQEYVDNLSTCMESN